MAPTHDYSSDSNKFPWRPVLILGIPLVLILAAYATDNVGIKEVKDDEVAVLVNFATGQYEIIADPGYKIFLPLFQAVYTFDKSPVKFEMTGDHNVSLFKVVKLTVRAIDGSSFWFDSLEIQYQIKPDKAEVLLDDSGPGDGFKTNWIRSYARSILRDEFGSYSARDMANPTTYETAKTKARDRLNAVLNPHGIQVTQIVTPKPKFQKAYEDAIAARKTANQEVERLKEEQNRLIQERNRILAVLEKTKRIEYEELLGTLEAQRIEAERLGVETRKHADAYKIQRLGEAEAERTRDVKAAEGLAQKYKLEAEGLMAKVDALEKQGNVAVREVLAKKLGGVDLEIVPYTLDSAPRTLRHEDAPKPPAQKAGDPAKLIKPAKPAKEGEPQP